MLRLENVRKKYNDFELECSLTVESGRITGLIGANGAGKSTTFKAILDLIFIDDGKIELFGKAHNKIVPREKEKIGVVLSDSGFSEYLTIQDVAAIMRPFYTAFDESDFLKKCNQMELPLKKRIKEFSTGMKAKLKLIAAMSHGAELLILDEPTAGLDVTAREELLDMLQEYMEKHPKCSILISSHISTDLEKICDDLYMIHNGKIILHEDTDVLLSDYAVLKVDESQYQGMEKQYLLRRKKENYGYSLLTDKRQFYQENYPGLVAEKSSIDDVILMMTKGENL